VCWEYFDKIYCISLDERSDRREEARTQFEAVGLLDRVEFVIVGKHPVDCEQGIYESHMLCMEKGLRAEAASIVIFEDDICFDRFKPETLRNSIDFISTHTDWNILFLGCMVKQSHRTANRSVLNVRFRSLCHAYVLNPRFARHLVTIPWQRVPFDDMLRDLKDDGFYAVYPSFAFQSNSRSDNQRYLPLDRFRRLCGGLRCLQKMNEFYHLNKTIIIGIHIFVVFILIGMLTCSQK
jgi:GR25 family glycosyltransferase involved in LPS biosynthesis